MCKIISERTDKKAVVLELDGKKFAVTKECMPKEKFDEIFPSNEFVNWKFIRRDDILCNQDVIDILKKKRIGIINCSVRQLN